MTESRKEPNLMLLLLTVLGKPSKMLKTPTPAHRFGVDLSTPPLLQTGAAATQERNTHLQGGSKERSTNTPTLPSPPKRDLILHGAPPKKEASDSPTSSPDSRTTPPSVPL